MPALRLEHDKIWAWWALDLSLKNMLKWVWWCKCPKMKSWNWTIYCSMSCSNERKNVWARGGRRSHVALRCCWKGNVLLLTHVKASKKKGCWSTINLIIMTKSTKAQLPKQVVGVMVDVDMNLTPPKVIGKKVVYKLKVLLSHQKILYPKGL